MISKSDLKKLVKERIKDAEILLSQGRYDVAFYMAGYALELSLKLKICKIFQFSSGFPENKTEFNTYKAGAKSKRKKLLLSTINKIQEIRNHDLNKLLQYSGQDYNIKLRFLTEWLLVINWSPELRYQISKMRKKEAEEKINAIKILVTNIFS